MLLLKALPCLLGLASLGAASSRNEKRADNALKLAERGVGRRGAGCSGTSTWSSAPSPTPTSTPTPTTTCAVPDPTANPVSWDAEICKCGPYKGGHTYGPHELRYNWYEYLDGGYARCDVRSNPRDPTQREVVPNNAKFQDCINACAGSFEKAKRSTELDVRQSGEDWWFCHAVNFVEGELCEFVGEIESFTYVAGGSDTWIYPSFEPTSG